MEELFAAASAHLSLDAPLFPGEESSLLDCLPDSVSPGPDERLSRRALGDCLDAALETLEERESHVLRLYFGLGRATPRSLEEIGAEMGITRERVRQIKEKALTPAAARLQVASPGDLCRLAHAALDPGQGLSTACASHERAPRLWLANSVDTLAQARYDSMLWTFRRPHPVSSGCPGAARFAEGNRVTRTITPKTTEIDRAWWVVDAEGKPLGRLASEVARVLRGKPRPIYTPHLDTGDHVIVINSSRSG